MPRKSHVQLYQVHIADGFISDCDELVHRCVQVPRLDFHEFSKIWKEMSFDLLYQGRTSGAELAELSEELVHIAKCYMVKDTKFFQESVAGLFLVYGLLNLQPYSGFACLRLVPSDVRATNRIEMVARRERRLDILFILAEVLIKWTQYHAVERPHGMEMVIRKYLEGYTCSLDKRGVRPMGVFYRQNEELDHIRDLASTTRQYLHAKKLLYGNAPAVPSMQYINENLANELDETLRKLVSGFVDSDQELDDNDLSDCEKKSTEDRSVQVQSIKERAMSNLIGPMNHLTSIDDRKKLKTKPKDKTDLKSPPKKIKTGSQTKPTTTSPNKNKKSPGKKPNNRGKRKILKGTVVLSSTDEDSDELESVKLDKDEQNNTTDKENHVSKQEGIEVEITSLPVILRPGDLGDEIEIEIIDHLKPKSDEKVKLKNTKKYSSSSSDDEPLSISAARLVQKTYKKRQRKDENTDVKIFPIRKKEKRELVRRELTSKFKRMGMLPIANLDNQDKN